MSAQLKNKVAIVTGANSGLGQAIALLFAKRGAKVTLCGRDQERLKSAYDQAVEASGGHEEMFTTVQGDLNESSVRKEVVSKTIEKFGRLDILVGNAGVTGLSTVWDATEETYDKEMNTNLKAVFFLIQEALPELVKTKGNIVNISSVGSTMVTAPVIIFPMSKAALDHLSRCLALDLGPKGIRVNTVNPSFFQSRILRSLPGDPEAAAQKIGEMEKTKQPLEGRIATPEEIAETVAFLASDAASFITGQNFVVDGGRGFTGPFGEPWKQGE